MKNKQNKGRQKSQAKSMVMIPLYRSRTEASLKGYSRKPKHAVTWIDAA